MLRRALTDVNRLKKAAKKVEVKEFNSTFNLATADTATSYITSFNIPTGDDSASRTGNRVTVKWIKFRIRVATTNSDAMRV